MFIHQTLSCSILHCKLFCSLPHLTASFLLRKNKQECKNGKRTEFMKLPWFLLPSAYEGTNSYFRPVKIIICVLLLRQHLFYQTEFAFCPTVLPEQGFSNFFPAQILSVLSHLHKILPPNKEITTHTEAKVSCHCISHPQKLSFVSTSPFSPPQLCLHLSSFKAQFIGCKKKDTDKSL